MPDATLASGGVYSAFAIGTDYADSLQVLLVQDNAAAGTTASATATATASASDTHLPDTGGSTWLPVSAALALTAFGILSLALVRRSAA